MVKRKIPWDDILEGIRALVSEIIVFIILWILFVWAQGHEE